MMASLQDISLSQIQNSVHNTPRSNAICKNNNVVSIERRHVKVGHNDGISMKSAQSNIVVHKRKNK